MNTCSAYMHTYIHWRLHAYIPSIIYAYTHIHTCIHTIGYSSASAVPLQTAFLSRMSVSPNKGSQTRAKWYVQIYVHVYVCVYSYTYMKMHIPKQRLTDPCKIVMCMCMYESTYIHTWRGIYPNKAHRSVQMVHTNICACVCIQVPNFTQRPVTDGIK